MLGHGVADSLRTVAHKLSSRRSTITVDGLGVTALRGVGRILGGSQAENVGPLLELFGICEEVRTLFATKLGSHRTYSWGI